MSKKYIVFSIITILFLVISYNSINVLAMSQTVLEENYMCDETTGWKHSTQKHHMAQKSTAYYMSSESMKALYQTYVTNGANLWGSNINLSYSTSGPGYIYAINDSSSSATAATSTSSGSDGITTSWYIEINSANFDDGSAEGKKRTLAHELGHVYGLGDLYISDASSQIMYGYYSASKNVTTSDINGMSVVTETHTHAGYYPKTYEKYSNTKHKVRCSTCKSYHYELHTSTSYCANCGYSE